MHFALSRGRRCSPLLTALALVGVAAAADAGVWGPDFNISGGDVNDTFTSANNQRFAAVNDTNDLYIAFYDNRNKTAQDPNNFEIYFRRFIFGFGSPTVTRVTNAPNPSKDPAIATLNWGPGHAGTAQDSGRIYLAWRDARLFSIPQVGEPISYTIFLRTYMTRGGEGFGPEIQVSPYDSLNAATSPSMACGDSSRVWIVYQRGFNGGTSLYYAVYNSLTRTVGPEQLLVTGTPSATNPAVAATRDGVVHVVWSNKISDAAPAQLWTKRFVPGTGWTPEEQVVFSSNVSTNPSLVATYTGHLHLVWRDNRDGNNEVYYKEYVPGTGWNTDPLNDTRLTAQVASQIEPQVDADPMNNVYVVWSDQRNGASNQDIFYRERVGGVWQAEASLVGAATDTTNSPQQFPGITHDGTGKLYATWTDWRLPASGGKNKEVYYKEGTGFVTAVEGAPTPGIRGALTSYPNPFNPSTTIDFRIDRDAVTTLRVYDARGRLVRTLVDGYLAAGRRTLRWDGKDDRGIPVASGTYFVRLQGGGAYLSRTVNLLK